MRFRSTVKGWLDPGDGRRRFFANAEQVPRHAPDSRVIDHLLHAIPQWVEVSWRAAEMFLELVALLQPGRQGLEDTVESFMLAPLKLELLGRPNLPDRTSFPLAIQIYPLKFMLEDCFALLGAVGCTSGTGAKAVLKKMEYKLSPTSLP